MTISLIVINFGIFFAEPITSAIAPQPGQQPVAIAEWIIDAGNHHPNAYMLQFGEGIKPWQGVTAAFLHANLLHLIGNMLFLFVFGLIVEGKIGWWKFLLIYLGIALVWGLMLQVIVAILNPGLQVAALGASGVIFGLMAIAVIWAPLNNLEIVIVFQRFGNASHSVQPVDVPVVTLAGGYLLLDIVTSIFIVQGRYGFVPYTCVLHATGALLGAAIGLWMLRWKIVDCERFDIFSVWAGDHEKTQDQLDQESAAKTEKTLVQQGLDQIRQILDEGENPQLAYRAHVSMAEKYASWHLPEREFLTIIKQLCDQQRDRDAVLAMEEYLKANRLKQNQVRMKLASLLTGSMQLPGQALSTLLPIRYGDLSPKEQALYERIATEAKTSQAAGVVDLPLDDW
ncbi:rhomboid family intramembrane serine protease [Bremerella volcania]|uniref:rhomboid family intramembrane serine protease n=1 Tax=Bremerella volcania TaxID=2527984 RepID=UPI0013FD0EC7|nr:rhomboid family intramembrane serine protease [Bremerella volcania]